MAVTVEESLDPA